MLNDKLEGYEAGADDYLSKPFQNEELKAKISVFLRLFNLEQSMAATNQSLEEEVKMRTEQNLEVRKANICRTARGSDCP